MTPKYLASTTTSYLSLDSYFWLPTQHLHRHPKFKPSPNWRHCLHTLRPAYSLGLLVNCSLALMSSLRYEHQTLFFHHCTPPKDWVDSSCFACLLDKPNVTTLAGWRTILRWWWCLSQENFLHVLASSLLTFCLTLRKLGRTSRWCESFSTQVWPESWTPTHGDIFMLMKMTAWAIHIFSDISVQPILWGHLFSPYFSHLWADPNAEKSPTPQNSSSIWTFLRVCGKMVLVLSNQPVETKGPLQDGLFPRKT